MSLNISNSDPKSIKGIPKPIKNFIYKVAAFYISWSLLYAFFIQPNHKADLFLTHNLGTLTGTIVQLILPNHKVSVNQDPLMSSLFIDSKLNIYILDGCNGFELYVLYIGFILCFPFRNKSTFKYIALGLASIFVLNVTRCVVLSYLKFQQVTYFDLIHHYIFTIIVYGFICGLWYKYMTGNLIRQKQIPVNVS